MITIRKNGAELQMSHEDVQQLTPEQQAQLARFLSAVAEDQSPPVVGEKVAVHSRPVNLPDHSTAAKPHASGRSYRVPQPDALPPDADPTTRAKMMVAKRPRSHKLIDGHLVTVRHQGAITAELMAAVGVSQTEVSRAVSGLRRIEEGAPLPAGTLIIKSKGKTPRWTAGPLLVQFYGGEAAVAA